MAIAVATHVRPKPISSRTVPGTNSVSRTPPYAPAMPNSNPVRHRTRPAGVRDGAGDADDEEEEGGGDGRPGLGTGQLDQDGHGEDGSAAQDAEAGTDHRDAATAR